MCAFFNSLLFHFFKSDPKSARELTRWTSLRRQELKLAACERDHNPGAAGPNNCPVRQLSEISSSTA